MKNIKIKFSELDVDINLEYGIRTLADNSGIGKTFFFTILKAYLIENRIKFLNLDYESVGKDFTLFKEEVALYEYIFLDDADLYITQEMVDILNKFSDKKYIIVAYKGCEIFDLLTARQYNINFTNDSFEVSL